MPKQIIYVGAAYGVGSTPPSPETGERGKVVEFTTDPQHEKHVFPLDKGSALDIAIGLLRGYDPSEIDDVALTAKTAEPRIETAPASALQHLDQIAGRRPPSGPGRTSQRRG